MSRPATLVTGAAGFVGRHVVRALAQRGEPVRAAVRRQADAQVFAAWRQVETVVFDLRRASSLPGVLDGIDRLYHFAAAMDARDGADELFAVNADGTRALWECAAAAGTRRAVLCSTVAVYGLLARGDRPLGEEHAPRAVEPYGRSKALAERAALEVARAGGPATLVLRPAAVFGAGDRTRFGRALRRAAASRLLVPGPLAGKAFSFVHVEDVARAAVHLMDRAVGTDGAYNVAVDPPEPFERAFDAYRRALSRSRRPLAWTKLLARASSVVQGSRAASRLVAALGADRATFRIGRTGFDATYSSRKLAATGFEFRWRGFEEVLLSCIEDDEPAATAAAECSA